MARDGESSGGGGGGGRLSLEDLPSNVLELIVALALHCEEYPSLNFSDPYLDPATHMAKPPPEHTAEVLRKTCSWLRDAVAGLHTLHPAAPPQLERRLVSA
jgi:hypothetical protein